MATIPLCQVHIVDEPWSLWC